MTSRKLEIQRLEVGRGKKKARDTTEKQRAPESRRGDPRRVIGE